MIREIRPQAGPQTDFLATPADICIYGGAAGGGKTFATLIDALRYKNVRGFGAVIFRKNSNQIFAEGGLWDETQTLYSGIRGALAQRARARWIFFDNKQRIKSKISFAHIERDDDLKKMQGSQICCELDTLVLMADGSKKKIADINIGDFVMTPEGARKVVKTGNPRKAECVKLSCNGFSQIQTADHKFLTNAGWLSYEDIIRQQDSGDCFFPANQSHWPLGYDEAVKQNNRLYEMPVQVSSLGQPRKSELSVGHSRVLCQDGHKYAPHSMSCVYCTKQNYSSCRHVECSLWKSLEGRKPHEGQSQGFQLMALLYLPKEQDSDLPEICACTEQRGQGSYCVSSPSTRQEYEQPLSDRHALKRLEQADETIQDNVPRASIYDGLPYVQNASRPANLKCHCLDGSCQCDGRSREEEDTVQGDVPLQGDVAARTRNDSLLGAPDTIREHTHQLLHYAHPYTGEERIAEAGRIDFSPFTITPCGKRCVRSITIDDTSNYITVGGIINRNCGIYFDELTHFSERSFFYMLSRNRSTCGIRPYVRATCNPDADSWVAKFIEWWIDKDTGYPIKERSGAIRWMMRRENEIYWADTKEELIKQFNLTTPEEQDEPKTVAFIASTVYDNQILIKSNPAYLANLKALPVVERERLLMGNWKIKPAAGMYFKRIQIRSILQTVPADVSVWARGWDLAATAADEGGDPAYTAGVLIGKRSDGTYVIADVVNERLSANDVRQLIKHTAEADRAKYKNVRIRIPQDPGQAGKAQAKSLIKFLAGFSVRAVPETGSKETRAEPVAAQWQAGNIDVVYGKWNDMYFDQMESFPSSKFKDMVDATSSAFDDLSAAFNLRALIS